jgi:hypothetical protein
MKILPQVINRNIEKTFKNLANSKFMTKHIDSIIQDETAAAKALIITNVARDALNYSIYVKQSLNNKNVPEEKRKYIAALDFSNGLLVCFSQVGLGFLFTNKKLNNSICNKLFGSINKENPELFKNCKQGYTIVTSLVISSIIAKRIIVPFIAAPMASWIKNKFLLPKNSQPKLKYLDSFQYSKPLAPNR